MMRKEQYQKKIMMLKKTKKGASPEQERDISLTILGMRYAFGDGEGEDAHRERLRLLFSEQPHERRQGKAYRKGISIVTSSVRGKKTEEGTTLLNAVRVDVELEQSLNKIKTFMGVKTLAQVRKLALQWYVDMMREKYGKDF